MAGGANVLQVFVLCNPSPSSLRSLLSAEETTDESEYGMKKQACRMKQQPS